MALLTRFTKRMILKSAHGDVNTAIIIALNSREKYEAHTDKPICASRLESLNEIIEELQQERDQ